jgi:hypothetical protein
MALPHVSRKQSAVSEVVPVQSLPPSAFNLICLVRVFSSFPHVSVQLLHPDQLPHIQSTKKKRREHTKVTQVNRSFLTVVSIKSWKKIKHCSLRQTVSFFLAPPIKNYGLVEVVFLLNLYRL